MPTITVQLAKSLHEEMKGLSATERSRFIQEVIAESIVKEGGPDYRKLVG